MTPAPAEIFARIPAACRDRKYLPALALLIADYAGLGLCLAGAMVLPGPYLKLACVIGAAFFIGGLYVIGHDAGHGVLLPSRRASRWIARLAFLPAYTPLTGWFRAHVLLHHNFLRVKGRDMVWAPWSVEEYHSSSLIRRAWYRFLRTPVGLSFYWTVGNWVPYLLFPSGAALEGRRLHQRFDRLLVAGYAVAAFFALWGLTQSAQEWDWAEPVSPLGIVLLGLVMPYFGWTCLIGLVDFVHHTHPRAVWFKSRSDWDYFTANVASTTHMVLPWGLNRLTHGILDHTAHHTDPRIPMYHLAVAQARLEEAFPEAVNVERFTPAYVWRLWRTCRLYDFDRRQWLDYDGTPTSQTNQPTPSRIIGVAGPG